VRYFDVNYNNYKSAKATVHFCSRSLLIELVTDQQAPIYKLLFKYMAKEPILRTTQNNLPLHVEVTRIISVPVNQSAPQPYRTHMAPSQAIEAEGVKKGDHYHCDI
jgi:hypothetical protein